MRALGEQKAAAAAAMIFAEMGMKSTISPRDQLLESSPTFARFASFRIHSVATR